MITLQDFRRVVCRLSIAYYVYIRNEQCLKQNYVMTRTQIHYIAPFSQFFEVTDHRSTIIMLMQKKYIFKTKLYQTIHQSLYQNIHQTDQIAPNRTKSHQIAPNRTKSHQIAPNRTKSHQIAPNRTNFRLRNNSPNPHRNRCATKFYLNGRKIPSLVASRYPLHRRDNVKSHRTIEQYMYNYATFNNFSIVILIIIIIIILYFRH